MQRINLLIFDLDGTLVDTLDDIAASVNYALACLNKRSIPAETVRRFVGDGARVLLARALEGSTEQLDEALRLYKEHYRRNLVVHSALYPGMREILEYFKPIPLAVISNKTMEFIDPLLERLGIGRYFRTAIGADHGIRLKPAPDSVLRILADVGAPPQRTALVGDGTTDVIAGRAAGVITCAVTYGFRSEDELRKVGPDHIVHQISELKQIFIPAAEPNSVDHR